MAVGILLYHELGNRSITKYIGIICMYKQNDKSNSTAGILVAVPVNLQQLVVQTV